MSKTRVVAYYMHETERIPVEKLFSEITPSFMVGDLDEAEIKTVQDAGLIVQAQPLVAPEPHPSGGVSAEFQEFLGGPRVAFRDRVEPEKIERDAGEFEAPQPIDYYVISLNGPLLDKWRKELTSMNVQLVEAVGPLNYKAKLRSEQLPKIQTLSFVSDIKWIEPLSSAPQLLLTTLESPSLGAESGGPGARMLTFDVRLRDPKDREKVQEWLSKKNIAIAGASGRKIRFYAFGDSPAVLGLSRLPEVDIVAEYVPPKLYNNHARRLLGIDASGVSAPTEPYISQDGSGEIVAIADTGIDENHPDFKGRIVGTVARGRKNNASDPDGHGTHVAGSVLGDGTASGGEIKGTAPKAKLYFQSLLDAQGDLGGLPLDLNDLFAEAYDAGARIHSNSWGADTKSRYVINSEEVDEFVHGKPDMLIVIAAGNAGSAAASANAQAGFVDWLSIGSPATCKNALTVGASRSDRTDGSYSSYTWKESWPADFPDPPIAEQNVSGDDQALAAFSSRGPCDDRRIKPDVVAPGTDIASTKSSLAPLKNYWGPYPSPPNAANPAYAYDGGTSMATPLVTGCAALVRQYYVQDRKHNPSAALVKATLINGTAWLSGADSTAPADGVPNFHQGFGRINMRTTIPNKSEPNLTLHFIDDWNDAHVLTQTGENRRYQFSVPKGLKTLRLCLAYTDAPARGLQNNLDLFLQLGLTKTKWYGNQQLPNSLHVPDTDNNVEIIRVDNPADGVYYAQVVASNMLKPPQPFALVITGAVVGSLTIY